MPPQTQSGTITGTEVITSPTMQRILVINTSGNTSGLHVIIEGVIDADIVVQQNGKASIGIIPGISGGATAQLRNGAGNVGSPFQFTI